MRVKRRESLDGDRLDDFLLSLWCWGFVGWGCGGAGYPFPFFFGSFFLTWAFELDHERWALFALERIVGCYYVLLFGDV